MWCPELLLQPHADPKKAAGRWRRKLQPRSGIRKKRGKSFETRSERPQMPHVLLQQTWWHLQQSAVLQHTGDTGPCPITSPSQNMCQDAWNAHTILQYHSHPKNRCKPKQGPPRHPPEPGVQEGLSPKKETSHKSAKFRLKTTLVFIIYSAKPNLRKPGASGAWKKSG